MLRLLRLKGARGYCLYACVLLGAIVCGTAACDDEKNGGKTGNSGVPSPGGGTDRGTESGMAEGTDSGTETGTDTAADSASSSEIESEVPPILPKRCSVNIVAQKVSGPGSGTLPSLSGIGDDMMAAFTYNPKAEGERTKIQLGYFNAENSEWFTAYPFEDAVTSSNAQIVHNGDMRALVWLAARQDWYPNCTPDTPDACRTEVAFATLTAGQVNEALPIRVSSNGMATDRPFAAPVEDGWVVVWAESHEGSITLWSAKVSVDGSVSSAQEISGEFRASKTPELAVAAIENSVIALWRAYHHQAINYVLLDGAGAPQGAPSPLAEGVVYAPRVTAGHTAFLVSYGAKSLNDAEIYTRMVGTDGQLLTEKNRITWTDTSVVESFVSYAPDMGYAITWLSSKANGSAECVDTSCKTKVFASLLDDAGALASEPVMVSEGVTDLNSCYAVTLGATTNTWVTAYEILRYLRQQILYSTFTCQ